MWEGNCWNFAPQEITERFPSLLYIVHQQLVTGNNGLYTVVVGTKSLSENISGLGVKRAAQSVEGRIHNVLRFSSR